VSKTYADDCSFVGDIEPHCREVGLFAAESNRASDNQGGNCLQVSRHRCPAASRWVAERLACGVYDVVHVEGFYLFQHVPRDCAVPIFLVEQNVEYLLWKQRAAWMRTSADRARCKLQYELTRAAELETWRASEMCGALTPEDRDVICAEVPGKPVRVVPDGADHGSRWNGAAPPGISSNGHRGPVITFVANFGYQPNVDAAHYLCNEIFPRLAERVPDAQLKLVGTSPPPEVVALAGNAVEVTGRVPEVEPYLDAATVVVCPLRVGGGVKVKMLEAARRGKAIVSTPVGAQGLGSDAALCMRVADDPATFAHAVAELIECPEERRSLEEAASRLASSLPTWDDAADAVRDCYAELTLATTGRA
jgi:glycosyltransferase involved in cell wall biosynthesis